MVVSRHQNVGQNNNIKVTDKQFEKCDTFQIFGNNSKKSKLHSRRN
jgi:hypothetical protein